MIVQQIGGGGKTAGGKTAGGEGGADNSCPAAIDPCHVGVCFPCVRVVREKMGDDGDGPVVSPVRPMHSF